MPTLYPENTTYQTGAPSTVPSPTSRFQDLSKRVQERARSLNLTQPQKPIDLSSLTRSASIFGGSPSVKGERSYLQPSAGYQSALAPTTGRYEQIPQQYSGFYTGQSPESMTGVLPSTQAKISNFPTSIGGGQYVIDQSQPGELIKSVRGSNPFADKLMRGALSPYLYQIDHTIPLWLGGADTIENRQILSINDHKHKTTAQSVAYQLLANNKIGLNEARTLALNWKDRDTSFIKDVSPEGFVQSLPAAEEAYKQWTEKGPQPVTLKQVLKGIPNALKNFGEGWLPSPIRELIKGGISGLTGGIIPYEKAEYKTKTGDVLGTIGGMAGNIAGSIISISKFVKLAGKALGVAGSMGIPFLKKAAPTLITDIGSIENAQNLRKKAVYANILRDAGIFAAYGQTAQAIGSLAPWTPSEEKTIEAHMKRFFFDASYGGLLGGAGRTVPGYTAVAAGTLALGLMQHEDVEDALVNAAVMTGLHAIGGVRGKTLEEVQDREASKMARAFLNKWTNGMVPDVKKGESRLYIPPVEWTSVAKTASDNIYKYYKANEGFGYDEAMKTWRATSASIKHLYNQSLPPKERAQASAQDIQSVFSSLSSDMNKSNKMPRRISDMLDNAPLKMSEMQVPEGLPPEGVPTGSFPLTGLAKNVVGDSVKNNITMFENATPRGAASDRVYLVSRPDIEPFIRGNNQHITAEEVKANTHRISSNPQNNLQAFVAVDAPDGRKYLDVGWGSRRFTIDEKTNSYNRNYEGMIKRIRNLFEGKDVPGIQKRLADDKAKMQVDEVDIDNILRRGVNSIGDEELLSLLKPKNALERFSPDLNKDTIIEGMNKNKISVLVADVKKVQSSGVESDQPHFIISITPKNWQESMMLSRTENSNTARQSVSMVPAILKEREAAKAISQQAKKVIQRNMPDADEILKSDLLPGVEKEQIAVSGVLKEFKDTLLTSKDATEFKNRINETHGGILSDDAAKAMFNNKENVTVENVIDSISNGVNANKESPFYGVVKELIEPFFKSRQFGDSKLSAAFLDLPLISEGTLKMGIKAPTSLVEAPRVVRAAPTTVEAPITPVSTLKETVRPIEPTGGSIKDRIVRIGESRKKVAEDVKRTTPTTLNLKGLSPEEMAGVEKARQTGGIFRTDPGAPVTEPVKQSPETLTTKGGVKLEKATNPDGSFWLEQNPSKREGKWTPLAQAGHKVEHLMLADNGYAGKIRVDGKEMTYKEAEPLLDKAVESEGIATERKFVREAMQNLGGVRREVAKTTQVKTEKPPAPSGYSVVRSAIKESPISVTNVGMSRPSSFGTSPRRQAMLADRVKKEVSKYETTQQAERESRSITGEPKTVEKGALQEADFGERMRQDALDLRTRFNSEKTDEGKRELISEANKLINMAGKQDVKILRILEPVIDYTGKEPVKIKREIVMGKEGLPDWKATDEKRVSELTSDLLFPISEGKAREIVTLEKTKDAREFQKYVKEKGITSTNEGVRGFWVGLDRLFQEIVGKANAAFKVPGSDYSKDMRFNSMVKSVLGQGKEGNWLHRLSQAEDNANGLPLSQTFKYMLARMRGDTKSISKATKEVRSMRQEESVQEGLAKETISRQTESGTQQLPEGFSVQAKTQMENTLHDLTSLENKMPFLFKSDIYDTVSDRLKQLLEKAYPTASDIKEIEIAKKQLKFLGSREPTFEEGVNAALDTKGLGIDFYVNYFRNWGKKPGIKFDELKGEILSGYKKQTPKETPGSKYESILRELKKTPLQLPEPKQRGTVEDIRKYRESLLQGYKAEETDTSFKQ